MVFDITWLTRQQLTPPKRILERHSKWTTISCEKREIRAKFTQNEVWWKHFLSIEIHWQRRLNIQPHNLVKKTKEVIPICSFRSFNVKLQLWPTSWLWVVLTNPSTMLESSITFNSSFCKARPSFRCVHSRKPNKKSFSYVDMWTTMKKKSNGAWPSSMSIEPKYEGLVQQFVHFLYSGVTVSCPILNLFYICWIKPVVTSEPHKPSKAYDWPTNRH